ncbi:MAG: sulfur oxidation c-type cytochrome SoxX [Usitatibacter sp.]
MTALALLVGACSSVPAHDSMERPLASQSDASRGREVFVSREGGHCVLCHEAPGVDTFGNVGPSLAGVGSRLTVGQLRLRVADITKVDPGAVMPTFNRTEGMTRVASQYQGKPALTGQQVEDVVAWLATLR